MKQIFFFLFDAAFATCPAGDRATAGVAFSTTGRLIEEKEVPKKWGKAGKVLERQLENREL